MVQIKIIVPRGCCSVPNLSRCLRLFPSLGKCLSSSTKVLQWTYLLVKKWVQTIYILYGLLSVQFAWTVAPVWRILCYWFSFSFRLKDLGQIKEVKKITIPTAMEISLRIAVLPCVGPSLQGKIHKASCSEQIWKSKYLICVSTGLQGRGLAATWWNWSHPLIMSAQFSLLCLIDTALMK